MNPAGVERLPPYPPFPPWSSFPFQPAAGIHTSNLIKESLVGLETPATRQKAGTFTGVVEPGRTNGPAGTDVADVTVVLFGRESVVRLSHDWAAAAGRAATASPSRTAEETANTERLMGLPPVLGSFAESAQQQHDAWLATADASASRGITGGRCSRLPWR